MKTLTLLIACLGPLGLLAERPNLILVFIDDMGWGDFSCFGNEAAQTPHIDRLAEEGLRFDQFHVQLSDLLAFPHRHFHRTVPPAMEDHLLSE